MNIQTQPAKRLRHAICRRETVINGVAVLFALRRDGLHVRRKYARSGAVMGWSELLDAVTGQFRMNLENLPPKTVAKNKSEKELTQEPVMD